MADYSQEKELIKKICYSFDYASMDSRKIKSMLKDTIANALVSLGYDVVYAKKIKYKRFDERTNVLMGLKKGTLDMLFFRGKDQIAVEVNRSSVVRLKSIMKLIASGAQIKIAVLYPRKSGIVKDHAINQRISDIKKAKNITSPIVVVNLADKTSYYV